MLSLDDVNDRSPSRIFSCVYFICRGQRINIVRIFLSGIKKMAKTALDGKTESKFAQIIDQVGYREIQFIDVQYI